MWLLSPVLSSLSMADLTELGKKIALISQENIQCSMMVGIAPTLASCVWCLPRRLRKCSWFNEKLKHFLEKGIKPFALIVENSENRTLYNTVSKARTCHDLSEKEGLVTKLELWPRFPS